MTPNLTPTVKIVKKENLQSNVTNPITQTLQSERNCLKLQSTSEINISFYIKKRNYLQKKLSYLKHNF